MVACQKCGKNMAAFLYGLYRYKSKEDKTLVLGRKLNLCAACGLSVSEWMRTFQPKDEDGNRIGEPIFYRPWVTSKIIGKPDGSQASSTKAKPRERRLGGKALDDALARYGVVLD